MRSFYLKYFDTSSGEKYVNPKTQFQSYFIFFGEGKTRLELMMRPDIMSDSSKRGFNMGIAGDYAQWALPISQYLWEERIK